MLFLTWLLLLGLTTVACHGLLTRKTKSLQKQRYSFNSEISTTSIKSGSIFTTTKVIRKSKGTLQFVSDEDAFRAMERIEELNERLGYETGAKKERDKLNALLEEWEQQHQQTEQARAEDETAGDECSFGEHGDRASNDSDVLFVAKHAPDERVAIFGGNPSKRRQFVERKLAPYQYLDQYGSPRDTGSGDLSKLLQKIQGNRYDVVYLWTKFNCHASRASIRQACQASDTRFEEVQSLSYIHDCVA